MVERLLRQHGDFITAIRHLAISFDGQRGLIERDRNINRTPIDDHPATREREGAAARCRIGVAVVQVLAVRTSDTPFPV